ncbi:MAG: hypothetical protein KF727_14465 [Microbacteriaceae bacterium]|nr:hypothetical protein [Microbacteriaceae bacterium]
MVLERWTQMAPAIVRALPDATEFFTQEGERISEAVQSHKDRLTSYLETLTDPGERAEAQEMLANAEAMVLAEQLESIDPEQDWRERLAEMLSDLVPEDLEQIALRIWRSADGDPMVMSLPEMDWTTVALTDDERWTIMMIEALLPLVTGEQPETGEPLVQRVLELEELHPKAARFLR